MASTIILLWTGIIDRHEGGDGHFARWVVMWGMNRRREEKGVRGEISLECLWSEHVTFIELWAYPPPISRVFVSSDLRVRCLWSCSFTDRTTWESPKKCITMIFFNLKSGDEKLTVYVPHVCLIKLAAKWVGKPE